MKFNKFQDNATAKMHLGILIEEESIFKSANHIGRIQSIKIRECSNKETNEKFQMIDLIVEEKASVYKKSYSVDFMKKLLGQMNCKSRDLLNLEVVFSVKQPYGNVGYLGFVHTIETDETQIIDVYTYKEQEETDFDALDKLGL